MKVILRVLKQLTCNSESFETIDLLQDLEPANTHHHPTSILICATSSPSVIQSLPTSLPMSQVLGRCNLAKTMTEPVSTNCVFTHVNVCVDSFCLYMSALRWIDDLSRVSLPSPQDAEIGKNTIFFNTQKCLQCYMRYKLCPKSSLHWLNLLCISSCQK